MLTNGRLQPQRLLRERKIVAPLAEQSRTSLSGEDLEAASAISFRYSSRFPAHHPGHSSTS